MRTTRHCVVVAVTGALLVCESAPGQGSPTANPLLPYSGLLPGSGADIAQAAAFGPDGALWIASTSDSTDLAGAPHGGWNRGNVVVQRLDPETHAVLSSAWIEGTADSLAGLAFDRDGNAYVAGSLRQGSFPHTIYVGDPSWGGCFVARLARDGARFAWVAFLGGTGSDWVTGLTVTPDGDPVVCGFTSSRDFPLRNSIRASQENYTTYGDESDAFVTQLAADGSRLVSSTLLGGSARDEASAITVAEDGSVLVAGTTSSPDFPVTGPLPGVPIAGTSGGSPRKAFLAQVDLSSGELRRASLLGAATIAAISASAGELILLGESSFPQLDASPITAVRRGEPTASSGAFLARLAAADWTVLHSVSFGGDGAEDRLSMARAADGTIWVGGSTTSTDLPVPGAVQPFPASSRQRGDAFAAAFAPNDLSVLFATYLGGEAPEVAGTIAVAPGGAAWLTGATASLQFPVTNEASKDMERPFRGSVPGDFDIFVTSLLVGDPLARPAAPTGLTADVLSRSSVRLTWSRGSDDETSFAVFRRDREGFVRLARLPAGTTEWIDEAALAGRRARYAVQAMNEAGGSPAATADAETLASLDVDVRGGLAWGVLGHPGVTSKFRLSGTLATTDGAPGGVIDPRRDGVEWILQDDDAGDEAVVVIPPLDRGWRRIGRRLRWNPSGTRFDFDPATGRFDVRVNRFWPRLWPVGIAPRTMRITIGDDTGSVTPEWTSAGNLRLEIR